MEFLVFLGTCAVITDDGEDVDGDDHNKFIKRTLTMLTNLQDKDPLFHSFGLFETKSDDPSKDKISLRKTVFFCISFFYTTHRIMYIAHGICISHEFHHYIFS